MAILKIDQVQGKINTGNVPRTSALALPLSLANQQAQGFKSFSDGLINLYAAQRKEEDLNEAQSITDSLSIDLIKSYNKHSNNTDLEVALEGFNEDVNYKNFEDLGGWDALGTILYEDVTDPNTKGTAKPLMGNSKILPLINEIVYLFSLPSTLIGNITSSPTQYYISVVALWNC